MINTQIILKSLLKTIKYFPLVLPTIIGGLAVLAVDERRERDESVDYYGY